MKFPKIIIWSIAALGQGISGSDRIFIEFAKRWSKDFPVRVYVWEQGKEMCKRQGLEDKNNIEINLLKMGIFCRLGMGICYFARIFRSILEAIRINLPDQKIVVYSSSEFWMDSLPAFILKLRYPKITWAAAWYQTAPNPLVGFAEGKRDEVYHFKALLYWLAQLPIKPLVSRFADFVLVNNEEERKVFPSLNSKKRVVVVLGAINLEEINKYKSGHKVVAKVYDGVFQGRFHPQKGVLEIIDIWRKVVSKKPKAKLAMIGDGPLMEKAREKVKDNKLDKNIDLFGYVFDGPKKYQIFSQSKVVVHPAFYDSGGMASAEAMAFGLPCVGFDLKSYKDYYPFGLVKVPIGNLDGFAKEVVRFLDDKAHYKKVSSEGLEMIEKSWSWDKRAAEILTSITN